jgi:hypothetical protein
MSTEIVKIQEEINTQVANPQVLNALLATTFKGLQVDTLKQAILEGMLRKFTFQDFLEKNIYALPFNKGSQYSLVTSIDYARKKGVKGGVVGKSKPIYKEDDNGNILTCEVTIKKSTNGTIGDFTAEVYFNEYYQGNKNPDGTIKKNQWGEVKPTLWDTKPRTMIAKVAEMHALRMACPEELSQAYIEEEFHAEVIEVKSPVDTGPASEKGKIIYLLKTLGRDTSSKENVIASVKELTGLEVTDENLAEIRGRLEILVQEKNENK